MGEAGGLIRLALATGGFALALALALGLPASAEERLEGDAAPAEIRSVQQAPALAGLRSRAESAEEKGNKREAVRAWVQVSEALQSLGDWAGAAPPLERARRLVETVDDTDLQIRVQIAIGNLGLVLASPEDALKTLQAALARARETQRPGLIAVAQSSVGNAHSLVAETKDEEGVAHAHDRAALNAYEAAAAAAAAAGEEGARMVAVEARALSNAARVALRIDGESAAQRWAEARPLIDRMAAPQERAELLLHGARTLNRGRAESSGEARLQVHGLLLEANRLAEGAGAQRLSAHALLDLAELYREEKRDAEARVLVERVLPMLREIEDPVLRWRTWVAKARLDRSAGRRDLAIAAYAEALQELDGFRYQRGQTFGREESVRDERTQAVHFEYVDLILQRAAELEAAEQSADADLALAQRSLERLKVDELRDYFDDECVDAALRQEVEVGDVDSGAALIYPISFEDRIELLVTHPGGRLRRSVPISREALSETVNDFRVLLETRTSRRFLRPAQTLYDWLIRPVEADLEAWGIKTIVFVHGGTLRSAPMAALHDGKQFLIERFAVAMTPGLDLTNPQPLETKESLALLGGLSEGVDGFSPLPGVGRELESLSEIVPATVLLNDGFVPKAFERELGNKPYSIVHIASHASFADAKDAFVVSYEGRITIDSLSEYIGLFRSRDQPLELLMLSACETAVGDEDAALGLSGVAVKSGARSAVGTLWLVDDEAAQVISSDFYQGLFKDRISRAAALQRAQRKLIEDRVRRHPYYWAPFVLIGNWL
ncbi:MAG: CHAT domain-containing protein [Myxococcota bacterium]